MRSIILNCLKDPVAVVRRLLKVRFVPKSYPICHYYCVLLTVSIILVLFPLPPMVMVLELALRRRGAGATGGIGGGRRDIVLDAASTSRH